MYIIWQHVSEFLQITNSFRLHFSNLTARFPIFLSNFDYKFPGRLHTFCVWKCPISHFRPHVCAHMMHTCAYTHTSCVHHAIAHTIPCVHYARVVSCAPNTHMCSPWRGAHVLCAHNAHGFVYARAHLSMFSKAGLNAITEPIRLCNCLSLQSNINAITVSAWGPRL